MSPEALLLGLLNAFRPGTSLAAVLTLVRIPEPRRPLLVFCVAGAAWSWLVGMLVVSVVHGASDAFGGSTFTAVLDLVLGVAALLLALGFWRGWIDPASLRRSKPGPSSLGARVGRRLQEPSDRVVAAAGVATHIPGLISLVAFNAIASDQPAFFDAGVQVGVYVALWFTLPLTALVLTIVRPGAAPRYLEAGIASIRDHDRAVILGGLLAVGGYLIVKGTLALA